MLQLYTAATQVARVETGDGFPLTRWCPVKKKNITFETEDDLSSASAISRATVHGFER